MTVRPRGLDLLVIQPTALCNLDCRYCYVPDRQNPERLPFPLLEKLLLAVRTSNLAREQSSLKILWHAGEPLAAGVDFFRQAFELTERLIGDRWQIRHAIQTNATLITDAWCELFQAHLPIDRNFELGRLVRLAEQGHLVDRVGFVGLTGGVHRAHAERVDDGLARVPQAFRQTLSCEVVHQEADRAAMHAVDRFAGVHERVQRLQHEAVAA